MKVSRWLLLILLAGFVMRIISSQIQDPLVRYYPDGGDTLWYLANGVAIVSDDIYGVAHGLQYAANALPTAPIYLYVTGYAQAWFPDAVAIRAIWLLQAVTGTLLAYFAFRIASRLATASAGIWAAGIIAFSPALIVETRVIATESLYLFFVLASLWIYVEFVAEQSLRPASGWYAALCGAVFGLATLTRAPSLLFPLGLAGLIVVHRSLGRQWGYGLRLSMVLLLVYSAVVSTWTIHNQVNFGRFIIGSDQMMGAIWRGAAENDASPQENDALLGDETYSEQAAAIIRTNPAVYLQRRLREWTGAILQPHGTINFGDTSIRAQFVEWVRSGFSLTMLGDLVRSEAFGYKLLVYIWHYAGIVLGTAGWWLTRKQWPRSLALAGFIAYTLLLHVVLLALPRYIFPILPLLWTFAGIAAGQFLQTLRNLTIFSGAKPSAIKAEAL